MNYFGIKAVSAGFLLCTVGCGSVPVKNYDYTTEGSKEIMTYSAYVFDDNCASKPFNITMIEKPSNGTITIKQAPGTIGEDSELETGPNCAGKPVNAQEIFYSANEGFTGTDEFMFEITSAEIDDEVTRSKIVVNVE